MIRSYVQLNLQESVPHTSLDYLITLLRCSMIYDLM